TGADCYFRGAAARIDQVGVGHQRPDRENARPHRAIIVAQRRRRGDRMTRRQFITLIGGAAASPLAARAQQAARVRPRPFLHPYVENDPEALACVIAFREGLEALGWTENRNIRIEHRYSGGDLGRIRAYAQELVRSAPDLIVGSGTPITAALKQATGTI